jgi:uncharacterized protein with GYD domain
MAKFMISATYNAEGIKGVVKAGGTSRLQAIEKMLAGVGGTVESFYFAFGGRDVYVVVDVPQTIQAAAVAAAVTSSGAMSSYETIVLLTPEEIDEAMEVAVQYAPPGS